MHTLSRILDYIEVVLLWIAVSLLILMTAGIAWEVISRYLFNRPTLWAVDFSEYALFHIVLLASGWSMARGYFVRIDIVIDRLRPSAKRIVLAGSSLVAAALCAVIAWHGLEMTLDAYHRGAVFQRGLLFPRWPVLAAMPVGMTVLALELLRQAMQQLRTDRDAGRIQDAASL